MVFSVKTTVAVLGEYPRHPSSEVLETGALKAEPIINSRPFTNISVEDASQPALTPNNFLLCGTEGVYLPAKTTQQYCELAGKLPNPLIFFGEDVSSNTSLR